MSAAASLQHLAAKPKALSHSTHAGLLLQRKCACGSPTVSLTGECSECSSKKRLQTKLAIGASNDPLEQEADRVVDQVMAASPHSAVSSAFPHIQRFAGQATGHADPAPASVDRVLAGPGRPLDPALRQDMEQRFGYDFSRVRVHSGSAAERSAQDVNAHAYTVGHSIVFGASRFTPGTHEGRRLLAHELTHVVQQSGSAAAVQRAPTPAADPSAERAAAPIRPSEQLEAQVEAEDALGLKGRKRNDKNYAWSLGLKDRARIKKSWKLSPKLQQEITVKVRFFEGEAKVAYLRTIGPALEELPEEAIEILAEPPSAEKSCPIDQTILVYQGKPGQGRCVTENDTEVRQNYIDNYIVQADGLPIPNTTWENVDHDRVPQMKLTYKNGSTLVVDVKDITGIGVSLRSRQTTGAIRSLAKYEKRSDGFIYPIRSDGKADYVSYGDAENIVSLGAGLYDRIEELKTGFQLIEAGAAFGGDIGALGGIASMLGHPGGLFEPVPRKKTQAPAKTGTDKPTVSPTRQKQSQGPTEPPKQLTSRTPPAQKQIPKFSQSTEEQITALMDEHPTLTRVNAERAVQGPQGAVPQASGKGGTLATGTGSGKLPKVPDIDFRQPTARGSSVVLRREVKTWEGNQGKFNEAVGDAADQLQAGGGGELLVQVPKGIDARSVVQRFKGAVIKSPKGVQKFGRYRSIKITIVDPSGAVLLDEPLEFPPSRIPPTGGPAPAATGGAPAR